VFFPTLEGLDGPDPDYRIPAARQIRYVKIRQINGSTVHDLRRLERQFKSEHVEALILDFRIGGSLADDPHHAVLLADALLDRGSIGRLRTKSQAREFQADRDRLFRELPIAVLIDRTTVGSAEWIAAALQDNHAAVLVGDRTGGIAYAFDRVTVPGSGDVLQLATGLFERAGGRAIHGSRTARDPQPVGQIEPGAAAAGGLQPDIQVDAAALQELYGPARVPGTSSSEKVSASKQQKLPDAILAAAIRALESQLAVKANRESTNPQ